MATETVAADLNSITQGRAAFKEFRKHGAAIAAATILGALDKLDAESHFVGSESIDGDRATVSVLGTVNGKSAQVWLYFVREGGIWKLVPSHP